MEKERRRKGRKKEGRKRGRKERKEKIYWETERKGGNVLMNIQEGFLVAEGNSVIARLLKP